MPQVPFCRLLDSALDPYSLPPSLFSAHASLPPSTWQWVCSPAHLSLHSPVSFPSVSPASFSPSLHALPEANYPTSPWCPRAIPSHFLPISWCQLKAHTQSQLPSVLITHRSCHLPWSAQEASGTPGRHPSSECDLRVDRACGEGQVSSAQGWGREPPACPLPHQVLSSLQPSCWWGQPGEPGQRHRDGLLGVCPAGAASQEGRPRAQCVFPEQMPSPSLYPPHSFHSADHLFAQLPELWIGLAPVQPLACLSSLPSSTGHCEPSCLHPLQQPG